jgi:nucleoid-associated protein YgaU
MDAVRVLVMCLGVLTLSVAGMARAGEVPSEVRLPIQSGESPSNTANQVVVEPGDHLWRISERRLETLLGDEPSNAEIGPYWREVIEVNTDSLRSGDPDLIYPGEIVTLPPAS